MSLLQIKSQHNVALESMFILNIFDTLNIFTMSNNNCSGTTGNFSNGSASHLKCQGRRIPECLCPGTSLCITYSRVRKAPSLHRGSITTVTRYRAYIRNACPHHTPMVLHAHSNKAGSHSNASNVSHGKALPLNNALQHHKTQQHLQAPTQIPECHSALVTPRITVSW